MSPALFNPKLSYEPDKKDLKLIEYISDNARDSFTQIGKTIGVSKDRVRERLKRLENQLFILSYFPLLNYQKLGLTVFHVLIRLDDLKQSDAIISNLQQEPAVTSVITSVGKYDLYVKMLGKSSAFVLKRIVSLTNDTYAKIDMLSLKDLDRYSMTIDSSHKGNGFGGKGNIDAVDKQILSSLSQNARKTLVDMSKELSIPVDTLRYRVKQLQKKDIILSFHARTNKHRMGLTTYIVFLKLKDFEKISAFKEFTNVYYSAKMTGIYNYLIHFHTKNVSELYNMIKHIRNVVGNSLDNFEVLTILHREHFSPFDKRITLT